MVQAVDDEAGKRSRPSPDKLDAFKWLRDEELDDPDILALMRECLRAASIIHRANSVDTRRGCLAGTLLDYSRGSFKLTRLC